MTGVFATPRPVPQSKLPALGGTLQFICEYSAKQAGAGGIAAGLWLVYLAIGALLHRLPLGGDNLAAAGVVAFGRLTRAAVLVAILIVVAVSDSGLGLPAAIVYALAFTVELGLSLVVYFGGEAKA